MKAWLAVCVALGLAVGIPAVVFLAWLFYTISKTHFS